MSINDIKQSLDKVTHRQKAEVSRLLTVLESPRGKLLEQRWADYRAGKIKRITMAELERRLFAEAVFSRSHKKQSDARRLTKEA